MEYKYYDSQSQDFSAGSGTDGDLMRVVVTERDSEGVNVERTTLFRYYAGSRAHKLKYIVGPQSFQGLEQAIGSTPPLEAPDQQMNDNADYYLEYNQYEDGAYNRVTKARILGSGCSGSGGSGTFQYSYSTNGSWNTGSGMNTWRVRVIQTNPDTSVRYIDVNGLGAILTDVLQPDSSWSTGEPRWTTHYDYDSQGRVTAVYHPSACSSYNYSTHTPSFNSSIGLVDLLTYDANGNLTEKKAKQGDFGDAYWVIWPRKPGAERQRLPRSCRRSALVCKTVLEGADASILPACGSSFRTLAA